MRAHACVEITHRNRGNRAEQSADTRRQGGHTVNHHHDQRVAYYRKRNTHAWSRGFCIGFVSACILIAAFMYGERNAYGNERPAPRLGITLMSRHLSIVDIARQNHWPRHWRTWLRIGVCEQRKPSVDLSTVHTDADRYRAIYWTNPGNRFPGGLGFRPYNWLQFRPPSARHISTMNLATPKQQMWAAERIFQHFARIGGQGYGSTVWQCHTMISMGNTFGWYGFNADGSWR